MYWVFLCLGPHDLRELEDVHSLAALLNESVERPMPRRQFLDLFHFFSSV